MMDIFQEPPQVELLQWLARGSLKQNLERAIRLWIWLNYFYGVWENGNLPSLNLPEPFTFHDWRHYFFSNNHPHQETKTECPDLKCFCHKTNHYWLFQSFLSKEALTQAQWCQQLKLHTGINDQTLNKVLSTQTFNITRRSLQSDLHLLGELGWLKRQGTNYWKIEQFPRYPSSSPAKYSVNSLENSLSCLNPDLQITAQNLQEPLGDYQRFYLYVDYVVDRCDQDRVEDWQEILKQVWTSEPIPPILISYQSAKLNKIVKCYVYPVSIYYVRRSLYLCAFGTTPDRQGKWHNYRLEHIHNIKLLTWSHSKIPEFVLEHYHQQTLPNPEQIEFELEQAWGFDFYEEPQILLLRFDQDFHQRYIKGTHRHATFKLITYEQACQLIKTETSLNIQKLLLSILKRRSPDDAYYLCLYRQGDINVRQRLRAWRPYGEIFLPWELRQQMTQEIKQEMQLYL